MLSSVQHPSSTICSSEMHSWMQRMHTTVAPSSTIPLGMNCATARSTLMPALWIDTTVVYRPITSTITGTLPSVTTVVSATTASAKSASSRNGSKAVRKSCTKSRFAMKSATITKIMFTKSLWRSASRFASVADALRKMSSSVCMVVVS